ncbi:MAG: hypothetical protein AAGA68_02165 [Pseudomonadota bacterium]
MPRLTTAPEATLASRLFAIDSLSLLLSAVAMFGRLTGETTQGSQPLRSGAGADVLLVRSDMSTLIIDGARMTHRGLAPAENYHGVRSAALLSLTVHAPAPSRTSGLRWNNRTRSLLARER